MTKVWSDGLPRPLRDVQVSALDHAHEALTTGSMVWAGNLPPGVGKTAILRSAQREYGGDILVSDNNLMKQAKKDYPVLNMVMGRDNYKTGEEYEAAHKEAKRGTPSIFNPLSYHFARERGLRLPDFVGLDEAHLLIDTLTYISAYIFPVSRTKVPENAKTERDLIKWAYKRYEDLTKAISMPDCPGMLFEEFSKISRLKDSLDAGTQNQLFQISKEVLPGAGGRPTKCVVLTPLRVPQTLIRQVTNAKKVMAVSGTLSKWDAEQIAAGRPYVYYQQQYLTPAENRTVYYDPVPKDKRKDPLTLTDKIRSIYNADRVPTLVHVTYEQQAIFADLLKDLNPLVNSNRDKARIQAEFIKNGGIWLAAGCAEGIDLKYDACRRVIIPTLAFPNRGNIFVQKRIGLADGNLWNKLRTVQNTIQRLGRGIRAADDRCESWILDPAWSSTYTAVEDQFAALAMKWSTPSKDLTKK